MSIIQLVDFASHRFFLGWAGAFEPQDFTPTVQLELRPGTSSRFRHRTVGIENELHRRALVEIGIAFGRFLECDHLSIYDLCDRNAIVQDRLQKLTIIAQDRSLTGEEAMRFRPAETEIERQRAFRGLFVV